jgi:hypothetical protein
MSPLNHSLDTVHTEAADSNLTDMRRVSMALAFSPARQRRRKTMNATNGWFRSKLGINFRRTSRSH